ncbi:hypothetical protein BGZ46_004827 [Entomortierella lignicola]|nr:hypothetical protein BGZ46_004827 [Entomortierella lignicola]
MSHTDLKLWLLIRHLYKQLKVPFTDVKFESLSLLADGYQFLESPSASESSDAMSSKSNSYKNKNHNSSNASDEEMHSESEVEIDAQDNRSKSFDFKATSKVLDELSFSLSMIPYMITTPAITARIQETC